MSGLQYSSWRSVWVDFSTCKRENAPLHFKHGTFFVSVFFVCTSICFLRFWLWEKDLLQNVHMNGFSPVWILECTLRSVLVTEEKWHWVHLWGFSPVWDIIWFFKLITEIVEKWHTKHSYGLSTACLIIWSFRLSDLFDVWSHCGHLNCFSPVWFFMCLLKELLSIKVVEHNVHFFSIAITDCYL